MKLKYSLLPLLPLLCGVGLLFASCDDDDPEVTREPETPVNPEPDPDPVVDPTYTISNAKALVAYDATAQSDADYTTATITLEADVASSTGDSYVMGAVLDAKISKTLNPRIADFSQEYKLGEIGVNTISQSEEKLSFTKVSDNSVTTYDINAATVTLDKDGGTVEIGIIGDQIISFELSQAPTWTGIDTWVSPEKFDVVIESTFFDAYYWHDFFGAGTANHTLYWGTVEHAGPNDVTSDGCYLCLSIDNEMFDSEINAHLVDGWYIFDAEATHKPMTIPSGDENNLYVEYSGLDEDGQAIPVVVKSISDARISLVSDGRTWTALAEVIFTDNTTLLAKYEGECNYINRYLDMLPSMIDSDRDFVSNWVNLINMGDGWYYIDLYDGDIAPWAPDGSWRNHNNLTIYLIADHYEASYMPEGTYTVSSSGEAFTVVPGGYEISGNVTMSVGTRYFYIETDDSGLGGTSFISEGYLTAKRLNDSTGYEFEANFTDIQGYKIHTSFSGDVNYTGYYGTPQKIKKQSVDIRIPKK